MGQRALRTRERQKEKVRLKKWHFDHYENEPLESAGEIDFEDIDFKKREFAHLR